MDTTVVGGLMDEYALSDGLRDAVAADLVQPVNATGGLFPAAIVRVDVRRGLVFLDDNAGLGARLTALQLRFQELQRTGREITLSPTRIYFYANLVQRKEGGVVVVLGRRTGDPPHLRHLGLRLMLGVMVVVGLYWALQWLTHV